MHDQAIVQRALRLSRRGATASEIARELAIPRSTVREWLAGAVPHARTVDADGTCLIGHTFEELPSEYAYVLGLYLGDGCISRHGRGVFKLRLALDVRYPGIIGRAVAAIHRVRGGVVGCLLCPKNCVEVYSYWQHWPWLLPQHAPGKKHDRRIVLAEWQQELVARWPQQLLHGLVESDGCRFQSMGRNWSCPRWPFTNLSSDIRMIFCDACDRLALHWTASGRDTIHVPRKADVAVLDEFIGPKR